MAPSDPLRSSLSLLQAAKSGDASAFEAFMQRYYERILRIVRARIGQKLRARQDSMDIAQNAIVRVINGLEQFEVRSEGELINWISKLVGNEIKDQAGYHGAEKRRLSKEVPILPSSESKAGLESRLEDIWNKSPSQQLAIKDDLIKLESALDKLGEAREVIILREYSGLSFKGIGQELNISEDAARMKYVRAMDKLTDIVAKAMK